MSDLSNSVDSGASYNYRRMFSDPPPFFEILHYKPGVVKILSSKTAEINKLQVYKGNATHFFSTDLPILNPIKIELHANLYIRLIKFCKMIRSFKIFLLVPEIEI